MGRHRRVAGDGRRGIGVIDQSSPCGSLDAGPNFIDISGVGRHNFTEAVSSVDGPVEIDATAVASMLSFQYIVDGRSLVAQVKRRPWLATVGGSEDQNDTRSLARHGRRVAIPSAAARELLHHMRRELEHAFGAAQRITLLLSGGLDSRLAGAVLVDLARQGKVTDDIRAVTWGIPESRDRHYGSRVARCMRVSWIPIDLGPADLARNIEISARELGAMVSPVHLHAVHAVSQLDWGRGDKILAATLGNGVGRGTYLYRHLTYTRSPEPGDWLGLMRPEAFATARADLIEDLAAFRRRLAGRSPVAVHECEMLAHYVSGTLLPLFEVLGRIAAPVHQILSDPASYRFLWSLSPLVRNGSMYRSALRQCGMGVAEIPYALTNRPVHPMARREQNEFSPFVHRYPRWTAHELAASLDDSLSRDWFDSTELFDGTAIQRAWQSVRGHPEPNPQTTYVLLWLCSFRRLMEDLTIGDRAAVATPTGSRATQPDGQGRAETSPPWGFAGRTPDSHWQRIAALPCQGLNAFR